VLAYPPLPPFKREAIGLVPESKAFSSLPGINYYESKNTTDRAFNQGNACSAGFSRERGEYASWSYNFQILKSHDKIHTVYII
jgi:hypothetical protein